MVDLAPEGCISLRDFYDQYTAWKWNTNDLINELALQGRIEGLPVERQQIHWAGLNRAVDQSLAEGVALFAADELRAFVILPEGSERREIAPRAWRESSPS